MCLGNTPSSSLVPTATVYLGILASSRGDGGDFHVAKASLLRHLEHGLIQGVLEGMTGDQFRVYTHGRRSFHQPNVALTLILHGDILRKAIDTIV